MMTVVPTRIVLGAALAAVLLTCPGVWAQPATSGSNLLLPLPNGLGISNVSLFSSYYSAARPTLSLTAAQPTALGYDIASGVQGTMGWSRARPGSSAGFLYSGSYVARARYSEWSSNSHRARLWLDRSLSRSWDIHLGANGAVRTMDQFLFENERLVSWAAVPATFEDLAASMLRGQFTNEQLASMLTGLPVVATPAQTLIYGSRAFSSGASLSLSYSASRRLRFFWGVGAGRMQALSPRPGEPRPLLNHSTSGNASAGVSYALNPRTELSFAATAGRSFSTLLDRYSVMGTLTLSRALTRQWFLSVDGGGGSHIYVREMPTPAPAQYLCGLTLARRSRSQTWMMGARRSMFDSYGVGSRTSVVADLAWSWNSPGSSWYFTGAASQQYMDRSYLNALNAWRLRAGTGRRLRSDLAIEIDYSYMDYRLNGAPAPGLLPHASVHALRFALAWTPRRPN